MSFEMAQRRSQFPLRYLVDYVDVDALLAVEVALVHRVHPGNPDVLEDWVCA